MDPEAHYYRDMSINGSVGVLTVDPAPSYTFDLTWRYRADRVVIRTCIGTRHYFRSDLGWRKNRLTVEIPHSLQNLPPGCETIFFEAYDIDGGHSFGVAQIRNPAHKLPLRVETDFKLVRYEGTAYVTDHAGSILQVKSYEPMIVESDCEKIETVNDREVRITIEPGFCFFVVVGGYSGKTFSLATDGWTDVVAREGL